MLGWGRELVSDSAPKPDRHSTSEFRLCVNGQWMNGLGELPVVKKSSEFSYAGAIRSMGDLISTTLVFQLHPFE